MTEQGAERWSEVSSAWWADAEPVASQLIQIQGDVNLGAAAAMRVAKGLDAGVDLRLLLFPGVGSLSVMRMPISALSLATAPAISFTIAGFTVAPPLTETNT